jgi:D-alanine-D-alanine ligase
VNRRRERIVVVMGGLGAEREVSIASGNGVMKALDRLGYEPQSVDFDERFVDAIRELAPDVVFNALHGPGGEDGTIQGVLEWLRVPYTGSDVRGCALAMDKHLTKKLLSAEGLPTPSWDTFDFEGGTLPLLPGSLNLPLVVKPRNEGSSADVSIVRTHEEWSKTMIAISERRSTVLAEEYVNGREFSCGVLFEEALPVIEIACRYWPSRRTGCSDCAIIRARISSLPRKGGRTFWRSMPCPVSPRPACSPRSARRPAFSTTP